MVEVIHVHIGNHEIDLFIFFVCKWGKFKHKDPIHGVFPALDYTFEYLIDVVPLFLHHGSGALFTKDISVRFPVNTFWINKTLGIVDSFSNLTNMVIGNHFREQMAKMFGNFIQIGMFKSTIPRIVKRMRIIITSTFEKMGLQWYFHVVRLVVVIFHPLHHKNLQNHLPYKKNINFASGEHSDYIYICFVFQHYKVTINFANHRNYK